MFTLRRFSRLRNISTAQQTSTSETATSPATMARRRSARDPDDPREAEFSQVLSAPDEVSRAGRKPTSTETPRITATANESTRGSMATSAVGGSVVASNGRAAHTSA